MHNKLCLFLLLSVAFACNNHSQQQGSIQLITADAFQAKLKENTSAQIIDVRTPEEFSGGHLEHALNINIYDSNFDQQVQSFDKNRPVFVYCKAGGRSADAASRMTKAGFTKVYDLQGGFMAWSAAGLPATVAESVVEEKFTIQDYEHAIAGDKPILIDYYAPWCGPCKKMEPILDELKREYADRVDIVRINVDEASTLVKREKIENIPVVTTVKNGKEINRVNGFQDKEALRSLIEELLR